MASDTDTCGSCGASMPASGSLCPVCGWDARVAVVDRPRRSLATVLAGGAWRVLLYGALVVLPLLGFYRFERVGPGPDLATTLRWIVLGDGGRAAALVTLHRAYETGSAAARYALREVEPPPFDGGWADVLAPYSTMNVRGWIPLLFYGADSSLAPSAVREFYEVRTTDGWGRPFRITTRLLPRGDTWRDDPEVVNDLAQGLNATLLSAGRPDFTAAETLRLVMVSAGRDGRFDTADDLSMVSYVPIGMTLHLSEPGEDVRRAIDRAIVTGRHWFRLDGSRWDLIDARLLAEFRLELLS